jgi:hypothetical protein
VITICELRFEYDMVCKRKKPRWGVYRTKSGLLARNLGVDKHKINSKSEGNPTGAAGVERIGTAHIWKQMSESDSAR